MFIIQKKTVIEIIFYDNRSIIAKFRFWPILAKMGTPKNSEMSFLMIKTCLVSKNSNRNIFYDNRSIIEKCRFWSILAKIGTPKNGLKSKLKKTPKKYIGVQP